MKNHVVAFESDLGSRKPVGWGYSGSKQGLEVLSTITNTYLNNFNTSRIWDG